MKVKFISSVLVSLFLLALMLLSFGTFQNASAQQQQRISFKGKYGVQLPYKLIEESSIPLNTLKLKLSNRTANSAGYVKMVVPKYVYPDGRTPEEGVIFYDINGNIINSKMFEKKNIKPSSADKEIEMIPTHIEHVSNYGKYFITETNIKFSSPVDEGITKYEIFDDTGTKKWEEEVTSIYDEGGPDYFISDYDGSFVKNKEGTITFYDPQGKVIKEVTYSPFELYYAAFSDDGNYFAMNSVNPRYLQKTEPKARFHLFDKQGEELWRYETEHQRMSEIFISPNGEYVLGSVYDMVYDTIDRERNEANSVTYIFRNDGSIVREYENMIINHDQVFISPEGKHAAIWARGDNGGILLVNLETGDILYSLNNGYRAADVLSEKNLVVFASLIRIVVLKLDGTPVFMQNYRADLLGYENTWYGAKVRFSEDGEEIFVLARKNVFRYRLQK